MDKEAKSEKTLKDMEMIEQSKVAKRKLEVSYTEASQELNKSYECARAVISSWKIRLQGQLDAWYHTMLDKMKEDVELQGKMLKESCKGEGKDAENCLSSSILTFMPNEKSLSEIFQEKNKHFLGYLSTDHVMPRDLKLQRVIDVNLSQFIYRITLPPGYLDAGIYPKCALLQQDQDSPVDMIPKIHFNSLEIKFCCSLEETHIFSAYLHDHHIYRSPMVYEPRKKPVDDDSSVCMTLETQSLTTSIESNMTRNSETLVALDDIKIAGRACPKTPPKSTIRPKTDKCEGNCPKVPLPHPKTPPKSTIRPQTDKCEGNCPKVPLPHDIVQSGQKRVRKRVPLIRNPLRKPLQNVKDNFFTQPKEELGDTNMDVKEKEPVFKEDGFEHDIPTEIPVHENTESLHKDLREDLEIQSEGEDVHMSVLGIKEEENMTEGAVNKNKTEEGGNDNQFQPYKVEESETKHIDGEMNMYYKALETIPVVNERVDDGWKGGPFDRRSASLIFHVILQGNDTLKSPIGVTQLFHESILVADTFNNRMALFNSNGSIIKFFSSPHGLNRPSAVVQLKDGKVAVKDNNSITIYTSTLAFSHVIGIGSLQKVFGLSVTEDGDLMTVEEGRFGIITLIKILPYDDWKVLRRQVNLNLDPDHVWRSKPRFIACRDKHRVLVVDLGLDCVFDIDFQSGQVMDSFGESGNYNGCFRDPAGIACDRFGNVFVADSRNHRIQVFNSKLKFECVLQLDLRLNRPSGICLTSTDELLVLNYWENSLAKFSFVSG